jgi:hypothetical protein
MRELPNCIVASFTGHPLQAQRRTALGDPVFKPFSCPACGAKHTVIEDYREHVGSEHPDLDLDAAKVSIVPDREDQTVALVIENLLLSLAGENLASIRKPNDPRYATAILQRFSAKPPEATVELTDKEYDWLRGVLGRKLPITKEQREAGVEQQTLGAALYGLSEYNVARALTVISERDAED